MNKIIGFYAKKKYLYCIVLFSLTSCYGGNVAEKYPKKWVFFDFEKLEECEKKFPNSFMDDCGAKRPKPSSEELNWLKKRLKSRLVSVDGGEYIMGDFGPIHTKDGIPPVTEDICYWTANFPEKEPKEPLVYEIGLTYSGQERSAPTRSVKLNNFAITSHLIEEKEYVVFFLRLHDKWH